MRVLYGFLRSARLLLAAVDEEDDLDDPRLLAARALVHADADRHAVADRDAAEAGSQAQLGRRRRGAGAAAARCRAARGRGSATASRCSAKLRYAIAEPLRATSASRPGPIAAAPGAELTGPSSALKPTQLGAWSGGVVDDVAAAAGEDVAAVAVPRRRRRRRWSGCRRAEKSLQPRREVQDFW